VLGLFSHMLLDGLSSSAGRRQVRYLTVAPLSGSGDAMRTGAPVQIQLASELCALWCMKRMSTWVRGTTEHF
jgi:hypothetical protein